MRANRILACVIVGLIIILGAGYTTADRALQRTEPTERFLRDLGYTDITITGWDWVAADAIWRPSTGFIATDRTGIKCSGAVVVDSDGKTRVRFR